MVVPVSAHDALQHDPEQLVGAYTPAQLTRRHPRHPLHVAAETHGVRIAEPEGQRLEAVAGRTKVVVRPDDARGEHEHLRGCETGLEHPSIELTAPSAGDRR